MGSDSGLFGDNSEWEPPDSISNSEVKLLSADDSVGLPCESRSLSGIYLKESLHSFECRDFFMEGRKVGMETYNNRGLAEVLRL